jgi:hypothetical protein
MASFLTFPRREASLVPLGDLEVGRSCQKDLVLGHQQAQGGTSWKPDGQASNPRSTNYYLYVSLGKSFNFSEPQFPHL